MNQAARLKLVSCLLVMVLGISLMAGCSSVPTPKPTPPATPAVQGTATVTSSAGQGAAATGDPFITGTSKKIEYNRGEDVSIYGNVQGGTAKSVTVTTYYLCPVDAPVCPKPQSMHNAAGFTEKKVIPVNADSWFSANLSSSAYKPGAYVAFLESPTGKYTSLMFLII